MTAIIPSMLRGPSKVTTLMVYTWLYDKRRLDFPF